MRLTALLTLAPLALARPLFEWGAAQQVSELAWDTVEDIVHVFDGDDTQKSILQHLEEDKDKYSTLVKLLNFEGEVKKDLDNTKEGFRITFFAPNNEALKKPKHHDGDDDDDDDKVTSLSDLAEAIEAEPWLLNSDDDDDDKDKKRRKEIFKKIVHAVLQYHILPQDHTSAQLAQNSTVATILKPHDGSADGLARRIHVQKQLIPPALVLNFYAKIQSSNEQKNGIIHELDHPLLPPGSIFDEIFLVSKYISTTSSALQGVGARKYVDWGYDHEKSKPGKPKFTGTPLATLFAPSNEAWDALPEDLHFYLFSRFGRRALDKLLAYHYVPHTLVLSELVHHEKDSKDDVASFDDDPSFHREFEVHTAVKGEKLKIVADKTKVIPVEGAVRTTLKVNDVDVHTIDIPASNGAWHIIDKVLKPPHHDGDHDHDGLADDWADWQAWLPAWVEQ